MHHLQAKYATFVNFPQKLRKLRDYLGLNQSQMGKQIAASRNLVSMMENEDPKQNRAPSRAVRMLFDQLWEKTFGPDDSQETPIESELSTHVNESQITGGRGKLKALRIKAGYNNPATFAVRAGYSPLIYESIENGSSNMSRKQAVKVARLLGCSVEDLLDGSDHPPSKGVHYGTVGETPDIVLPTGQKARYVPLLSMARCGAMEHGDMVSFDDGGYDHEGFLATNPEPYAFAVTLSGDSMAPVCSPGDVAVVYPKKTPLRNGSIVLAKLNDKHGDGVMLKLFQQSGDQVTLSSYNPAYPPVTWQREDFVWIYHVASVTKVFS